MAIEFKEGALKRTLDEAIAAARGKSEVDEVWLARVERLGAMGVKTYIAALGGALLAKATDSRVDSLTQYPDGGPRGYALRTTTEFLAKNNNGRFDMGARGRWPLNNRPFLGGPSRIDAFKKIHPRAKPAFDVFFDCLVDLNELDEDGAKAALTAWMRARIDVAETERKRLAEEVDLRTTARPDDLLAALDAFVQDDPEGGKRGQALAAAVFDCIAEAVHLRSINDPGAFDVSVSDQHGKTLLGIEVKQAAVKKETAMALAREAAEARLDKALLVVLHPKHQSLYREEIRSQALREWGVAVEVVEGVRELVGQAAVFSDVPSSELIAELPGNYAARMREHEVSEDGVRRWRGTVESLGG